MSSFEQRVAVFQMALEFPKPYARDIRGFVEDVLNRQKAGIDLTEHQAKLLLTNNPVRIQENLLVWADAVEASVHRLRDLLVRAEISSAFCNVRGWPDNHWRIYEYVLDMYVFANNPALQSPHEAAAQSVAAIQEAFPVSLEAAEPLKGADRAFAEQLQQRGNPWA